MPLAQNLRQCIINDMQSPYGMASASCILMLQTLPTNCTRHSAAIDVRTDLQEGSLAANPLR